MPDIEFHEIVGQIEDTAVRVQDRQDEDRLDSDPEKLKRMIRDEHLRAMRLATRLLA
ncbi:MAG: hypothetical protein ABJL99_03435 [Aliishimia sp.]